jgi:methyl-accepting chemotaxis protein
VFYTWSLRAKLMAISLGAVVITACACLLIQRSIIREQGIDLTRNAMRGVLLGAENVRQSVSGMQQNGVFDPRLFQSRSSGDYKQSAIYQTVPVVSAWKSIELVASKEGYQFHIAAHSPRNPSNQPRSEDEELLKQFEQQGATDFFQVDDERGEIVYARPVRLTHDCLQCHGDPRNSPNHDGRDIVGLPMENWREGQVHGAFVLRSKLEKLTPVIQAGLMKTLIWIIPVALGVGVFVFFLMKVIAARLGQLSCRLSVGAQEMEKMVNQLATASYALAQGASEQAAAFEQTSAASIQIKSMAQKASRTTKEASGVMSASQNKYVEANHSLDEMVNAMSGITSQSGKIAQIIKVIEEIAFQTHMLALNASVEAARAGDAGLGFAVVASEVGNLARRCAQAADDTASLIEESIVKSQEGRSKVDHVVEVMGEMTGYASRMKLLLDDAGDGASEQSKGIDQIGLAIQQMQQVTQTTAAHAQEGAAASSSLNNQSLQLKKIVSDLTEIVHGERR